MFCVKCGSQIADGAKFCPVCGTPVPAEPVRTPWEKARGIDIPLDGETDAEPGKPKSTFFNKKPAVMTPEEAVRGHKAEKPAEPEKAPEEKKPAPEPAPAAPAPAPASAPAGSVSAAPEAEPPKPAEPSEKAAAPLPRPSSSPGRR